jgi:hypothetical protein
MDHLQQDENKRNTLDIGLFSEQCFTKPFSETSFGRSGGTNSFCGEADI